MALSQAYLEWEQKVKQEGEQRGEKRGEQRGIAIGKQEGKQEVALNMLRAGMSVEQVVALTGLDLSLIQQLQ